MSGGKCEQSVIVRPVEILVGAGNIGRFLGLSWGRVQKMMDAGAPIVKRGKRGDLVCEKAEIWEWVKRNAL